MTEPQSEIPNTQECKLRALRAMENLGSVGRDANALSLLLQTAQVWATLATVPEPLEPVYATLESTIEQPQVSLTFADLPRLPVVRCPHGVTVAIIPHDADGQEHLRYTFALCEDCP